MLHAVRHVLSTVGFDAAIGGSLAAFGGKAVGGAGAQALRFKEATLVAVKSQLEKVRPNLARAASEEQDRAVAAAFDEVKGRDKSLEAETAALQRQAGKRR